MKKNYYLITQKSFNNDNIIDVGTFIEKIVLSTESEDFKMYWNSLTENKFRTMESVFKTYDEEFFFNLDDTLRKERKESWLTEYVIYKHLVLTEDEYLMLMKQTEDIPEREVMVINMGVE